MVNQPIAAYAFPAIPIAALGLPLVVYLPPFYTKMGLGLSVVGTIFMITRFWDMFTDPILGILSDKIETPLGKRRHWIILSVPILMLCVYKVFIPQPPVTAGYLLFWMIMLYVGWTLLSISHMSWGAELSSDYHERSRVHGWREFALVFGMLAVLILPSIIEQIFQSNSAMKVAAMGWFTIVLLPISSAIAVGVIYLILDWIGFVPDGANTAQTIELLKYIFVFTPILIMVLAASIMWKFPLDSLRQQQLRQLINKRDAELMAQ